LLKEQGSSNLVQNMGHKGPVLRPRWIGPGRAWTHILFYSNWCFIDLEQAFSSINRDAKESDQWQNGGMYKNEMMFCIKWSYEEVTETVKQRDWYKTRV